MMLIFTMMVLILIATTPAVHGKGDIRGLPDGLEVMADTVEFTGRVRVAGDVDAAGSVNATSYTATASQATQHATPLPGMLLGAAIWATSGGFQIQALNTWTVPGGSTHGTGAGGVQDAGVGAYVRYTPVSATSTVFVTLTLPLALRFYAGADQVLQWANKATLLYDQSDTPLLPFQMSVLPASSGNREAHAPNTPPMSSTFDLYVTVKLTAMVQSLKSRDMMQFSYRAWSSFGKCIAQWDSGNSYFPTAASPAGDLAQPFPEQGMWEIREVEGVFGGHGGAEPYVYAAD